MLARDADAILRAEGLFSSRAEVIPWRSLMAVVWISGAGYGLVMGSFGGRPLQALLSAAKMPCLVWVSTALCLPSFFVAYTVLGLRQDFRSALRAILTAQAAFALVLLALAPVTALGYVSGVTYDGAKILNGGLFALAVCCAQVTLSRLYGPLIARDRRHRKALVTWFLLYVFVAVQLAWVLRPFIGSPEIETRVFRESAWGNAYVEIWETVLRRLIA